MKLYEESKDSEPTAFDLDDLCNLFLGHKKDQAENGDIKLDTWKEYKRAAKLCLEILGRSLPVEDLRPSHFLALRTKLGEQINSPVTLRNTVVKLRALFTWAYDAGYCDRPLQFRAVLKRPPKVQLVKARQDKQKNLYSHKEICALLNAATPWMKAAIMLGLNAGLGNRDICELKWEHINGRWLATRREKTACIRRAWLWQETIDALPEKQGEFVFCGQRGQKLGAGKSNATPIGGLFAAVKEAAKIERGGFYTLRHTYRTVADAAKDRPALRLTMGHADSSIDSEYVEEIGDDRLIAISDLVHRWFKQTAQSQ